MTLDGSTSIYATTLTAPSPSANDAFGHAIAADGNYLVITAPGDQFSRGAAYLFTGANVDVLTYSRKLNVPSLPVNSNFGSAVAISGTRAVIGARGGDTYPAGAWQSADNGYAYVYELSSGTQLARLSPVEGSNATLSTTPSTGCFWFGAAVAIHGDVVVVGAPRARSPCGGSGWSLPTRAGAAFVFDVGTARQTNRLMPPDKEREAEFGSSVAVYVRKEDAKVTVLVGAPSAGGNGAVYAIGPHRINETLLSDRTTGVGTGWAPRLTEPGFGSGSKYGTAVVFEPYSGLALITASSGFSAQGANTGVGSLRRDWIVMPAAASSASNASASDSGSGSGAPVPTEAQLVAERNLWAPNAETGCAFGSSAALGPSGVAVVGANGFALPDGNVTGTAYVFRPRLMPRPPPAAPPLPLPPGPPPAQPPPPDTGLTLILPIALGAGAGGLMLVLLILGLAAVLCRRHSRARPGGVPVSPGPSRTRTRVPSHEGWAEPGTPGFAASTPGCATSTPGRSPSASTPSADPSDGLGAKHVGRLVVIHSLKSKPELNGRRGSLLSFDAVKQRWNVRVADQTVALRPINFDLEDEVQAERPKAKRWGWW